MHRFFSTGRPLLRIPPAAPSKVKQIPIPKTARTTKDIEQYVSVTSPEPKTTRSAYVESMFKDATPDLQLKPTDGVWYNVERSRAGNLPVYTDYNNAGGSWTEIRKISGNAGALRNDLKIALSLQKNEIWVKNAANVVVIKGNVSRLVKEFLGKQF